jgi:hypothetical protein
MISTMTPETYEQLSVSSKRTMLAASFPRKHVHSVFDQWQDALQAVQALRAAGYDYRDIHTLTNTDYVEAVGRGQTLFGSLTSTDLDVYLDEARRGRTMLAVRLSNYGQMEQVRDLLAPHHARLMKYIDTWTVAHLLP